MACTASLLLVTACSDSTSTGSSPVSTAAQLPAVQADPAAAALLSAK